MLRWSIFLFFWGRKQKINYTVMKAGEESTQEDPTPTETAALGPHGAGSHGEQRAPFRPKIGATVRVTVGNHSTRAMLLTLDDDGSCELLLTKTDEEIAAKQDAIQSLESFEIFTISTEETAPEMSSRLKNEARILFMKKDYDAASEWYEKALERLESAVSWRTTPEPTVLIRSKNIVKVASILALRGEDKALVSILNVGQTSSAPPGDDDDDMTVVETKSILSTLCSSEHRQLQGILHLNLTRCALCSDNPKQGIFHATIALRIAELTESADPVWSASTSAACYFLRAKAIVALIDNGCIGASNGIGRATRDLERSASMKPGQKEVASLTKEISKRTKIMLTRDRKLARDIGAWTESAMSAQETNDKGDGLDFRGEMI